MYGLSVERVPSRFEGKHRTSTRYSFDGKEKLNNLFIGRMLSDKTKNVV